MARHQLEDPPGHRGGDPGTGRLFPCLLGRHPRRRGVRCLSCIAPAREPGCTCSTWAKASRYVVGALARGATPGPLFLCPVVNCGAQYPSRGALEAVVQANAGLRNRPARVGGGTTADADLAQPGGLVRMASNNSLGVGSLIDAVSLDELRQRFATWKKVQPQLAGSHARLSVDVLGIFNHAIVERVYTYPE